MKKLLLFGVLCLSASAMHAQNIVEVDTSCGKVAYIDTDQAGTTKMQLSKHWLLMPSLWRLTL